MENYEMDWNVFEARTDYADVCSTWDELNGSTAAAQHNTTQQIRHSIVSTYFHEEHFTFSPALNEIWHNEF